MVAGGLGIVWSLLWLLLIADKPESARFISETEKLYILDSLKGQTEQQHNKASVKRHFARHMYLRYNRFTFYLCSMYSNKFCIATVVFAIVLDL